MLLTMPDIGWLLVGTFLLILRHDASADKNDKSRINSSCKATIQGKLYNLQSLQRLDGKPRFQVEYGGWNYSFNPCMSFNMPQNPHAGGADLCFFVAMCRWRQIETENLFYTVGLQSTARLLVNPKYMGRLMQHYPLEWNDIERTSPNDTDIEESASKLDKEEGPIPVRIERIKAVIREKNEFNINATTSQRGNQNKSDIDQQLSSSPSTTQEELQDDSLLGNTSLPEETTQEDVVNGTVQTILPHPNVVVLKLRGIGTYNNTRVSIILICDRTRRQVEEALFRVVKIISKRILVFALHHRCCCADECVDSVAMTTVMPTVPVTNTIISNAQTSLAPYYTDLNQLQNGSVVVLDEEEPDILSGSRHLWLILLVNGVLILMAVLIGAVFCRRGASNSPYNYLPAVHGSRLTLNSMESFPTSMPSTRYHSPDYLDYSSALSRMAQLPLLDNCVIGSNDLEIGQRLGGGLYSDTYLAEYKDRRVAAKRLTVGVHQEQLTDMVCQWAASQVEILSHHRHKNLVAVLGVCIDTRQPYILTEYVEAGSFRDLLRSEDQRLSWPRKLKMCIQAADGMAFLHSARCPIIHRDLRTANILVDDKDRTKVVDFGMTKVLQKLRQGCTGRKGCYCHKECSAFPASIRWTAPEILEEPGADEDNSDVFQCSCDVYSYAMVLWEVATCLDPFEDISDEAEVSEVVRSGGRPPAHLLQLPVHDYCDIMMSCWNHVPGQRPSFKQVAVSLKTALQWSNKHPDKHRSQTSASATTNYLKTTLNYNSEEASE